MSQHCVYNNTGACDTLQTGQLLHVEKPLYKKIRVSNQDLFIVLVYKRDGTLALYGMRKGVYPHVLWTTSERYSTGSVVLQSNGDFVMSEHGGLWYWVTGTDDKGKWPFRIVLQEDGNVVLYDIENKVLWAANTHTAFEQWAKNDPLHLLPVIIGQSARSRSTPPPPQQSPATDAERALFVFSFGTQGRWT